MCAHLFLWLSPVWFLRPILQELLVSRDGVSSLLLLNHQLVVLGREEEERCCVSATSSCTVRFTTEVERRGRRRGQVTLYAWSQHDHSADFRCLALRHPAILLYIYPSSVYVITTTYLPLFYGTHKILIFSV